MPIMFGKYPAGGLASPTIEESVVDGYATGVSWTYNYTPGGPHVINENDRDVGRAVRGDKDATDWVAYCRHTQECRRAWLTAFELGRSAQKVQK